MMINERSDSLRQQQMFCAAPRRAAPRHTKSRERCMSERCITSNRVFRKRTHLPSTKHTNREEIKHIFTISSVAPNSVALKERREQVRDRNYQRMTNVISRRRFAHDQRHLAEERGLPVLLPKHCRRTKKKHRCRNSLPHDTLPPAVRRNL